MITVTEPEPLKAVDGPWMVNPNAGCFEVLDTAGNVIGMAHEQHHAVVMASSTEMLNALIMIQDKVNELRAAKEFFPAGIPVDYLDGELEALEEMYSVAFEKIHAEADV